jgi:hypothetical protein
MDGLLIYDSFLPEREDAAEVRGFASLNNSKQSGCCTITSKSSALFPRGLFVDVMGNRKKRAVMYLNVIIVRLFFVMQTRCVYCEVRHNLSNIVCMNFKLLKFKEFTATTFYALFYSPKILLPLVRSLLYIKRGTDQNRMKQDRTLRRS